VSAEQTEQRRWAVTVSYTTEETYYVDAEDEDEAEDKALDECGEDNAEVLNCRQIAGSPKRTRTVKLTDGRTLEIPKGCVLAGDGDNGVYFVRVVGAGGRWWTNGHVVVEALEVEGHAPNEHLALRKPIEEIAGGMSDHGCRVESHAEVITGESLSCVEMRAGALRAQIQAVYWPLVYDPAVGLEPRILGSGDPVLGVREGRVVAAVMPVRQ
jgi:hypothetical protein